MKIKSNTKYRIILEYEAYYPQYKGWFFWHYFYRGSLWRWYFRTLNEAEAFMETRREYKQQNGFEIVKEYE